MVKKKDPKKKKSPPFATLEALFSLTEKHHIVEFEWEHENEKIKFKTQQAAGLPVVSHLTAGLPGLPGLPGPFVTQGVMGPVAGQPMAPLDLPGAFNKIKSNEADVKKTITAPLVGVFYRSASPQAKPFVEVGQIIKPGDVLCIIEAMKLMNEIEAEFSGKIISLCVQNGQPVEYGEPLFIIEPLSE